MTTQKGLLYQISAKSEKVGFQLWVICPGITLVCNVHGTMLSCILFILLLFLQAQLLSEGQIAGNINCFAGLVFTDWFTQSGASLTHPQE